MKLLKEYYKKEKENEEEFKIILGIHENYIKFIIKKGINNYNSDFKLNYLKMKDKYFRMFDTIEEAYKDLLSCFNENQYNLKVEENTLTLNIEIEHSHKKNIIPFILQKTEIKNDDLIKSLYNIVNNYAKENNGLKNDINILNTKVIQLENKLNIIENKIDLILNYINDKKEKEIKKEKENFEEVNFEKVLEKVKLLIIKLKYHH